MFLLPVFALLGSDSQFPGFACPPGWSSCRSTDHFPPVSSRRRPAQSEGSQRGHISGLRTAVQAEAELAMIPAAHTKPGQPASWFPSWGAAGRAGRRWPRAGGWGWQEKSPGHTPPVPRLTPPHAPPTLCLPRLPSQPLSRALFRRFAPFSPDPPTRGSVCLPRSFSPMLPLQPFASPTTHDGTPNPSSPSTRSTRIRPPGTPQRSSSMVPPMLLPLLCLRTSGSAFLPTQTAPD